MKEPVQIVFDGPPSHHAGRFVEVEQGGKSIKFGEWKEREDGFWVLELPKQWSGFNIFMEAMIEILKNNGEGAISIANKALRDTGVCRD